MPGRPTPAADDECLALPSPPDDVALLAARRRLAERLICEAAARYVRPYLRDSAGGSEPAGEGAAAEGQHGR